MPKLTAMMIVRNEAGRYLKSCLESLQTFTDEIIILDDASEDDTPEICLSYQSVKLYRQPRSEFLTDEALLRQKLWLYITEHHPEWILAIDADELLEESFLHEAPYLLKQTQFTAIGFRLFDCWGDETHFRMDGLWNPWLRGFSTYIVKYQSHLAPDWPPLKFHCGRIPLAYRSLTHYESATRIKHLGWSNPLEVPAKYERVIHQDPGSNYMNREHYDSILFPPEKVTTGRWV